MIYRPATGSMWDPSVIWHDGMYHAFMMYSIEGPNGLDARHCLRISSSDGVHWSDEVVVLAEREHQKGGKFFKCFVARCGDQFIMNHGVSRGEGQDMLRFYKSADLRRWTYLFSSRPDPRWYGLPPQTSRWDHMYMLPKEEGNPNAGYWGHPVSAPKPFDRGGVGMMQSPDGLQWEILPPAPIEFAPGLPIVNHLEWGGCERFAGKYCLIGGGNYLGFKGYGMYVLQADAPTGPFRVDPQLPRLCGNSHVYLTWLGAWCRGNGELLISNYASPFPADFGSPEPGSFSPLLLPLRRPVMEDGHLRMGWWRGNEVLKGAPLDLAKDSLSVQATDRSVCHDLGIRFDEDRGIVVEGRLRVTRAGEEGTAGPCMYESDSAVMAVLLGVGKPDGRETRIGRLVPETAAFDVLDVTGKYCATVTGVENVKEHSFRLLSRGGLFELYIDDLLMQTFWYQRGEGRVGVAARNAKIELSGLRAWQMSF